MNGQKMVDGHVQCERSGLKTYEAIVLVDDDGVETSSFEGFPIDVRYA